MKPLEIMNKQLFIILLIFLFSASIGFALSRNLNTRSSWTIKGKVTDYSEHPLSDVKVEAYDKDTISDDKLGQATTNRQGKFTIKYTTQTFSEASESAPDIYLKVLDRNGRALYSTKRQPRFNARRSEYFDIKIKNANRVTPKHKYHKGKSTPKKKIIYSSMKFKKKY